MIVSEKNKSFLWLVNKTGSNHAAEVFSNYDFFNLRINNGVKTTSKISANHDYTIYDGFDDYTFICTARNPFTRILSSYKFNNKNPLEWHPSRFRVFFFERYGGDNLKRFIYPFRQRTPDYFIRLENLVEDYGKIDFIKNSDFYQSGELKKLCEIKYNSTNDIPNPAEYFTEDIINSILTNGKSYFDLLNYSYPFM